MVHKAIIIDNTELFKKGTVKVKVLQKSKPSKIEWNLSINHPESLNENKNENNVYNAKLSGIIGGGSNYGMLAIPQINEVGLVSFLDGTNEPVWIGGLFEPFYYSGNYSQNCDFFNIPTDKGIDGLSSDGSVNGKANMDSLTNNIILRTKRTNEESKEGLDWTNRETSNIMLIGEKDFLIKHFSDYNGWESSNGFLTPNKWCSMSMRGDKVVLNNVDLDTNDYNNNEVIIDKKEILNIIDQNKGKSYTSLKTDEFIVNIKNKTISVIGESGIMFSSLEEGKSKNKTIINPEVFKTEIASIDGIMFSEVNNIDGNIKNQVSSEVIEEIEISDTNPYSKKYLKDKEVLRVNRTIKSNINSKGTIELDISKTYKPLEDNEDETEEDFSIKTVDNIKKEINTDILKLSVTMDGDQGFKIDINEETSIKVEAGVITLSSKKMRFDAEELFFGGGEGNAHLVSTVNKGSTTAGGMKLKAMRNTHI